MEIIQLPLYAVIYGNIWSNGRLRAKILSFLPASNNDKNHI